MMMIYHSLIIVELSSNNNIRDDITGTYYHCYHFIEEIDLSTQTPTEEDVGNQTSTAQQQQQQQQILQF
jgi:hypothetical protein